MSYEQRAREFAAKWKPRYLPMWHDREKDDLWREFDAGLTALCESIAAEARGQAIEEAALVACHRCRQGIPRYPYKSDPGNEQHRVGGEDGELYGECLSVRIRALLSNQSARA